MFVSARCRIRGIKPMLIHSFPIEALSQNKSKSGTTGDNPDEWQNTVLMTKEREVYLPASYLINPILGGGKHLKVGRGSLHKKIVGNIYATEDNIFLGLKVPEPDKISRNDRDPVYIDVRSVVNPMTKGRNVRYRVALRAGWEMEANLWWDDSVASFSDIKICVEKGGLFEGTGDARKIGFGRFELVDFENITEKNRKK